MRFIPISACTIIAATAQPALATQYLSVEEAQKAIFAEATKFVATPLKLTPDQMQQVEKLSGLPARSADWRVAAAYAGDKLLGYVVVDDVVGKFELITYAVGLNPDATVHQVEILTYRESHGFEIRNAAWRKQFVGKTASEGLTVGGGINNISGATLSCTHVTDGIRRIAAVAQVALRKS